MFPHEGAEVGTADRNDVKIVASEANVRHVGGMPHKGPELLSIERVLGSSRVR